jgi:hypothetical protein
MRLGHASTNNAIRALGQQHSARWTEHLGGRVEGGHVLELVCGCSVGAQIILERFEATI